MKIECAALQHKSTMRTWSTPIGIPALAITQSINFCNLL